MHASSAENMERCVRWYLPDDRNALKIADLGSQSVNGSYRELFSGADAFVGFDLEAGPGVDVVLDSPYDIPEEDGSFDLVVSGQMLEHCAHFWRVASEIERILKPGGLAFLIAPSAGPIHRYPVDCYRFYPDAWRALADWTGMRLVHVWMDQRGPWNDLVGVFSKGGEVAQIKSAPRMDCPPIEDTPSAIEGAETVKGARGYLEALEDIHEIVEPRRYVEIGVRKGSSLKLSECESIGVDPCPALGDSFENVRLFECTSDDFFFFHAKDAISGPIDLAFIDGMHLSEFVVRDFMNIERFMAPDGVILIDDVLPNHPIQARRERESRVWTGDVWRAVELIAENRPDLQLTWLDTAPTGLLAITGLKPKNSALWSRYNPVMRKLMADNFAPMLDGRPGPTPEDPPIKLIDRREAKRPTRDVLKEILRPGRA
ncbi:methyltransferase type 11 [Marinicauda salina]|uniref:Methyltransferase type 11 n=1 Tax=Marinicauda salina TaxID=2135793 RepID=A0A2U2BXL2_9PROT|nr:methyltransferase domain-containing protein [Marinicauda salina]PWE18737.1 methyltransferase type 11 [Marinicauda salina]